MRPLLAVPRPPAADALTQARLDRAANPPGVRMLAEVRGRREYGRYPRETLELMAKKRREDLAEITDFADNPPEGADVKLWRWSADQRDRLEGEMAAIRWLLGRAEQRGVKAPPPRKTQE